LLLAYGLRLVMVLSRFRYSIPGCTDAVSTFSQTFRHLPPFGCPGPPHRFLPAAQPLPGPSPAGTPHPGHRGGCGTRRRIRRLLPPTERYDPGAHAPPAPACAAARPRRRTRGAPLPAGEPPSRPAPPALGNGRHTTPDAARSPPSRRGGRGRAVGWSQILVLGRLLHRRGVLETLQRDGVRQTESNLRPEGETPRPLREVRGKPLKT